MRGAVRRTAGVELCPRPLQSASHDHGPGAYPWAEDVPSLRGVEPPCWVRRVRARHQEQPLVWKTFEDDVHESPAHSSVSGGMGHTDAHQLEVPTEPCLGYARLQHSAHVVGPPLAGLARVAIGKANKPVNVVSACETEPFPDAVLVPYGLAPGPVVGVVPKHCLVYGP